MWLEAIRSHRNLWGECNLLPWHLIMVPEFTTSFSIKGDKASLGTSADPWENPASPAPPWTPSCLPLLLPDSQKQGRENFHLQESVYHTYLLDVTTPFFQFLLDINLKSINPVASKALTPCSLSPLELERFSFKYSWGKYRRLLSLNLTIPDIRQTIEIEIFLKKRENRLK